jgi:hypothetical protein
MSKAKKQKLPRGWTQERVRKLAEYYDNQTDDEQAAEIDAALHAEGTTVMVVPTEMVPAIVKLITKKRPGMKTAT